MKRFDDVLNGFFSEAKTVCGSEGLFQSIFYHHARKHFSDSDIQREVASSGGKIDFLIDDGSRFIAIEIKAGANGHRNSLSNMKEVERNGKGLQHDLNKLSHLKTRMSKPVDCWLVCVDLSALGIAFSSEDIRKYSSLAVTQGISFAYLSQLDRKSQVWRNGEESHIPLASLDSSMKVDPWGTLKNEQIWSSFFAQVENNLGPECSHVGIFYHVLRSAGLKHNQLASEAFFNCNKFNTRQYRIPDFVVFEESFNGSFQLFGNNKRSVENDQFKLPHLVSVLEFKGGKAFSGSSLTKKIEDISSDVEKLAHEIKPRIESHQAFSLRCKTMRRPTYAMVVTDPDKRLAPTITSLRAQYGESVDVRWFS